MNDSAMSLHAAADLRPPCLRESHFLVPDPIRWVQNSDTSKVLPSQCKVFDFA